MSPVRPARLVVDRPDQLDALTSPLRLELLERFQALEPCALGEVARTMDRPADRLYYHLRALVTAGLLVPAGQRETGGRSELLYRLPADEIEIPRRSRSRRGQRAIRKAIEGFLRLAGREFTEALDDPEVVEDGPGRTFYGGRRQAHLTAAELRQLNRHLDDVERLMARAATRRRTGRAVAVTIIVSPARKR